MAEQKLREEYQEWIDQDCFTANTKLKGVSGNSLNFVIGSGGDLSFSLKFPADYPKTKARFEVSAKDDALEEWVSQVQEFCNGPSSNVPPFPLSEVLDECANSFAELVEAQEDDGADEYDHDLTSAVKQEMTAKQAAKPGPQAKDFFVPAQGTGAATARLLSDLERVRDADWGRKYGFIGELCKDPETGLPDLYHWHIKLVDFDRDDSLYDELHKRKIDHILLDLQFPFDYPNNPPFVRVIHPRFAFRTGHVTVGGSICMEVLTSSGWLPTNDVESVIIQIRAEMNGGGAKLDHGNTSDYAESEAFAAFDRVAGDHQWKSPDWRKYRRV
eukprot:TRINITY_DN5014_c0_g1_i2.p1 TRINITY_DN5014_c0_g1~~TRINITY_DN5014_c0_g1_i2.p1  ORF type:complete len:346 (-),score=66.95 TRINITY_DN5014_c0_g1_i2:666-1652(-)